MRGIGGRTAAALWGAASRTYSVLLAAFLSSCRQVFSISLVNIHVVHAYNSIDTTAAWKKLRFILSVRSDFQYDR